MTNHFSIFFINKYLQIIKCVLQISLKMLINIHTHTLLGLKENKKKHNNLNIM